MCLGHEVYKGWGPADDLFFWGLFRRVWTFPPDLIRGCQVLTCDAPLMLPQSQFSNKSEYV